MNEALKQLENLLGNAAAGARPFPPNSRYNGIPVLTHTGADGRTLAHLARRFIPSEDRFASFAQHTVVQGDRLDNLSAHYLTDPEQYWKLCDANGVARPDALTEAIGRSLRVALPEGIG